MPVELRSTNGTFSKLNFFSNSLCYPQLLQEKNGQPIIKMTRGHRFCAVTKHSNTIGDWCGWLAHSWVTTCFNSPPPHSTKISKNSTSLPGFSSNGCNPLYRLENERHLLWRHSSSSFPHTYF